MLDENDSWRWDSSLFAGAAPYYDRGRLPYAEGLAEALQESLHLDGRGRLLDLGCGPGTVTLRLAHLFEEAIGLDPDPGMLAEAARLAHERSIENVRWIQSRAEDLGENLGQIRVATVAASFHWMEREKVAAIIRDMLEPGGALVHVDNRHQDGLTHDPTMTYPAIPDAAIRGLRNHYLGPLTRAGLSVRMTSPGNEAAVFRAAGFSGPEIAHVADGRVLERSVDDVVAQTLSMSSSAPHLFGERLREFEEELRALLFGISPAGYFSVRLPANELLIWRP
jgi:SAM-dependent methyltransferase